MKLTSPCLSSGARASTATSTPTALGSATFDRRTRRSWPLPGSAQRCLAAGRRGAASAIVREDVLFRPAGKVEPRAGGQEVEAGARELGPALTLEPLVEALLECVEVTDVARGIFPLRVVEVGCA